ncbi:MAG: hypothetical protein AB1468_01540 [Candidatus Micrarchaeota archaeon]
MLGLIKAKEMIIEEKSDLALFPLRGAWPIAKVIQLAASLERQSSELPVFKYPPFSSHYFSKRVAVDKGLVFKNKKEIFSEYLNEIKNFFDTRGIARPKFVLVDEVLSGSSVTGTYKLLNRFMKKTYGKGNYELITLAICDKSHIRFTPPNGTKKEQVMRLVREGKLAFYDAELNKKIIEGRINSDELGMNHEYLSKGYYFIEREFLSLLKNGEVGFKNEEFNNLAVDGKITPVLVNKLFTTDSKDFLYGLKKTIRQLPSAQIDFPAYTGASFSPDVFKKLQALMRDIETYLAS